MFNWSEPEEKGEEPARFKKESAASPTLTAAGRMTPTSQETLTCASGKSTVLTWPSPGMKKRKNRAGERQRRKVGNKIKKTKRDSRKRSVNGEEKIRWIKVCRRKVGKKKPKKESVGCRYQ